MLAKLALSLALFQTAPTVTLVFPDRTVTMTVTEAQQRLVTERDLSWRVALNHALGTLPDEPRCITWAQHVAEVTSWHQAPERVYVSCDKQ